MVSNTILEYFMLSKVVSHILRQVFTSSIINSSRFFLLKYHKQRNNIFEQIATIHQIISTYATDDFLGRETFCEETKLQYHDMIQNNTVSVGF